MNAEPRDDQESSARTRHLTAVIPVTEEQLTDVAALVQMIDGAVTRAVMLPWVQARPPDDESHTPDGGAEDA
jgi:hypothetical protein